MLEIISLKFIPLLFLKKPTKCNAREDMFRKKTFGPM